MYNTIQYYYWLWPKCVSFKRHAMTDDHSNATWRGAWSSSESNTFCGLNWDNVGGFWEAQCQSCKSAVALSRCCCWSLFLLKRCCLVRLRLDSSTVWFTWPWSPTLPLGHGFIHCKMNEANKNVEARLVGRKGRTHKTPRSPRFLLVAPLRPSV